MSSSKVAFKESPLLGRIGAENYLFDFFLIVQERSSGKVKQVYGKRHKPKNLVQALFSARTLGCTSSWLLTAVINIWNLDFASIDFCNDRAI